MSENTSLKNRFTDAIMAKILSGELRPGDRLPPERSLAESMGISRGSVNQGLLDMERMGFLLIVPRKGTFVADFMSGASPQTLSAIMSYDSALIDPELFRDLMDMRILVECECAGLAAKRIKSPDIAALNERVNRIFSAEPEQLTEVLFEFHTYITALSGNRAYTLLFRSFEKMIRSLISTHYADREELRRILPLYGDLARAISRGDPLEAKKCMHTILGYASEYLNGIL